MPKQLRLRGGRDGRMSHAQMDLQTLGQAAKCLTQAQEELRIGRNASARSQVELARRFLNELHVEGDDSIEELATARTGQEE